MIKKLQIVIFSLLFVLFALGSYSFFLSQKSQITSPSLTSTQETRKNISLSVDFGNENTSTYKYSFTEDKTVFDVLKEISEKEGLEIETQQYDFGIFVKSINGYESGTDMAWIYFVNGQSGQVAADQQELKDGDLVEWKYIRSEM